MLLLFQNLRYYSKNTINVMKYLNVAEKNDAAKTISNLLSNGSARRVCLQLSVQIWMSLCERVKIKDDLTVFIYIVDRRPVAIQQTLLFRCNCQRSKGQYGYDLGVRSSSHTCLSQYVQKLAGMRSDQPFPSAHFQRLPGEFYQN